MLDLLIPVHTYTHTILVLDSQPRNKLDKLLVSVIQSSKQTSKRVLHLEHLFTHHCHFKDQFKLEFVKIGQIEVEISLFEFDEFIIL